MIKIASSTIEATTQNLVLGQVILTILLAISLKQMWNLLNVIQVLVFIKNFTLWPAGTENILIILSEVIYLEKFSNWSLDFGKS